MPQNFTDDELIEAVGQMDRSWVLACLAQLMADFIEAGVPPTEIYGSVARVCDRLDIELGEIRQACN